jgi:hypothetical protein
MHMMRKGQIKRVDSRDAAGQAKFIEGLFGIAVQRRSASRPHLLQINICNGTTLRT